jgi:hypothetical protein
MADNRCKLLVARNRCHLPRGARGLEERCRASQDRVARGESLVHALREYLGARSAGQVASVARYEQLAPVVGHFFDRYI